MGFLKLALRRIRSVFKSSALDRDMGGRVCRTQPSRPRFARATRSNRAFGTSHASTPLARPAALALRPTEMDGRRRGTTTSAAVA